MNPNFKNYNYYDPLFVVTSKNICPVCKGEKQQRKTCIACKESGYLPINLNGLWYPSSAFLVCGGPSLNKLPFQRLRERGIVSLAVNNVASHVPVTSWCFSDPENKFHHGLFLDPKCMTFSPIAKFKYHMAAKTPDKKFRMVDMRIKECPSTFGFNRRGEFNPERFLLDDFAHWGMGGKQPEENRPFTCLCTMLIGFRLLHYLGCPRIYLLGVDLWMTDEQPYAFQQEKKARNGRYTNENEMLRQLKPIFDKNGFEVFNCNPESKCNVFPYVSFDEALKDCRGGVPEEPLDTEKWYDKNFQEQCYKENGNLMPLKELIDLQQKTTTN